MKALISVYDKAGLVDLAVGLTELGVELIASGGTGAVLHEAGYMLTTVEEITGLPHLLDGRVKTLHPAIHAGILARATDADRATLAQHDWPLIDLVIVNLYPFAATIAQPDITVAQAIEQIDIGGVALIRAAAKNFERVTVVADPADYASILNELRESGQVTVKTRRRLAAKAMSLTAAYDQTIAQYLAESQGETIPMLPPALSVSIPAVLSLRYGENPHQEAAYYAPPGVGPLGGNLLQGSPLSYNNLLDLDAAWSAASDFSEPTVVIVKHLSPCGIASNEVIAQAFQNALASDPTSAFGGVVAANRLFDEDAANALGDLFVEAITAPEFTKGALGILSKRKNCRVLKMNPLPPSRYQLRSIRGGVIVQTHDQGTDTEWNIVTDRKPTKKEMSALRFAWRVAKHVKSNAIVLSNEAATVGIGGGLPSRVDAVKLAVEKAGTRSQGAVMASDAFFPFPDGLEVAVEAGVTAIVQPGGSIRDDQVIAAANAHGIAMVVTGVRHFRH